MPLVFWVVLLSLRKEMNNTSPVIQKPFQPPIGYVPKKFHRLIFENVQPR